MPPEKYKVALVCDWFFPQVGGVETQMKNLGCRLIEKGHEVHAITGTPGPSEVDGIQVHRLKVRQLPAVNVAFERSVETIFQSLFKQEQFDLIHGHALFSSLAHLGVFIGKEMGIPTVITNHSLIQGTPSDLVCSYLYRYLIPVMGSLCFRRLVRPKMATPDVITAVSRIVAKDTARIYRCNDEDVQILPNGILSADWRIDESMNPTSRAGERFRITCVSRFHRTKRLLKLVREIPRIYQKLPEGIRPIFTLVGDGPQNRLIRAEVEKLGLSNDVEFTGYLGQEKIRELFGRTDLFVLPSYKEGFGIAVLEARTAGLPVVAMNHGGVADILQHGRDGFLANTYGEFRNYVASLVLDQNLRNGIRKNIEKPMPEFEWDQIVERHLEIYRLAMERCQQNK